MAFQIFSDDIPCSNMSPYSLSKFSLALCLFSEETEFSEIHCFKHKVYRTTNNQTGWLNHTEKDSIFFVFFETKFIISLTLNGP